jgi:large subunit ribosomal protein L9e
LSERGSQRTSSRPAQVLAPDAKSQGKQRIRVAKWYGKQRELAAVRSVLSHIENMFTGVRKVWPRAIRRRFVSDSELLLSHPAPDSPFAIVLRSLQGFKYTMKLVYAHFPVNVSTTPDKKVLEIRNFLGEKVVRRVPMKEGCTVDKTGDGSCHHRPVPSFNRL